MRTSKRKKIKQKNSICGTALSLLLCTIFFAGMISCQKIDEPIKADPVVHSSNVIRTDLIEYGPYIFADGKYIRQYNLNTNLLSPSCVDPECQGTCLLEAAINKVTQAVDEKMFFSALDVKTLTVRYGYQDLVTRDIKVLVTLSQLEDNNSFNSFVWNGYMYYSCKLLREGGDSKKPDDYRPHICRISVNGGDEEVVFESNGRLEMVVADKILTTADGNLNSYDIETGEKRTLINLDEIGYKTFRGKNSYLDGKLYFLCGDGSYCVNQYNGKIYGYTYLLSVDIHTGEVKRVVEDPVISFALTNEAIYYAPFELRYMYVPENYEENPKGVVIFLASPTLYACDLNGENTKAVYTNETMDYIEAFTVIDNKLYGWLYEFDDANHAFKDSYFGCIDLETKEIIPADVEEHPAFKN